MSVLTSIIFLFYFQFSYNFFLHSLIFKIFILSSTFFLLLPFHLPTALYFNIAIHLSLNISLFVSSYPFPLTINLSLFSILCVILSLSLSLSLSLNVLVYFYFLLNLYFMLINFCVFKNSNLG